MEGQKKFDIKYRCYEFSLSIIKYIETIEPKRLQYSILDQVLRSSTSVGANVVEGKSGSSKKDLIKFFQIALKSANETKYWLCLIRDSFNLAAAQLEKINLLIKEADEISKILAASIITLKDNLKAPALN